MQIPPVEPRSVSIHRPIRRWWLAPCLLCITLLAQAADTAPEIKSKQADLENLRERIESIEKSLSKVREDQGSLAKTVQETEQAMSAMNTSIRELDAQARQHEKESAKLSSRRDEIQNSLEKQLKLLGLQVRSSYVSGRQQKVKILLNQEDPALLGRLLAYYEYLVSARTQRIEAIQLELLELIELEAALQKELENIQSLKEERTRQLAELESKRDQRHVQITALEKEIKTSGQELNQLRQQEKSLQNLIQALKESLKVPAEFRNAQPFANSKGRLPWPMRGQLLARYGQAKHGTRLTWNGIWIAAKGGTPVRAVSNGRVVYVGWLHRYGLIVLMEHPGGYYSLYGHNQEATVAVGDHIQAGHILARAGDSGGHRRTGVYFEIRKGKSPVNPVTWLQR